MICSFYLYTFEGKKLVVHPCMMKDNGYTMKGMTRLRYQSPLEIAIDADEDKLLSLCIKYNYPVRFLERGLEDNIVG